MRVLIIILGVLFCYSLAGQNNLNYLDNTPKNNYLYKRSVIHLDYQNGFAAGDSAIWDFSSVEIDTTCIGSTFYTENSNYPSFPGMHWLPDPPDPEDSTYLYSTNAIYRVTDTMFSQTYKVNHYGDAVIEGGPVLLKFPCSVGDSMFYNHETVVVYLNHYIITQSRICRAVGTLIMPDSTYDSVVQFMSFKYSSWSPGKYSWTEDTIYTYDWYSTKSEVPLLTMIYKAHLEEGSLDWERDTSASILSQKIYTPYTLGINSNPDDQKSWIYPNPAKDFLHLKNSENITSVEIFDVNSRLIKKYSPASEIDVKSLNSGVYLLRISLRNGNITSGKLLKE